MSKLRLLFIKEAQASYISHLDTMRTFQRVFPRAELHLKHSNGFHPHPIISIVLPLPVGQESVRELLEISSEPAAAPKRADGTRMTDRERRELIAQLEDKMRKAAKMLEYEIAAQLRDEIIRLRGEDKS